MNKIVHKPGRGRADSKVINIGPGNLLISRTHEDLILEQITIVESIDIDPMLSWFWPSLKQSSSDCRLNSTDSKVSDPTVNLVIESAGQDKESGPR